MQRSRSTFRVLALSILSLVLGGAAHAGYWEATYDLTGSTATTTNPGGVFVDPITGTLTIRYEAASSGAPLVAGRIVAGTISNTISQPAGLLTVVGANTNTLMPGPNGALGVLSGTTMGDSVVTDHEITGFLHCYDPGGGTAGNCAAFFGGVPASNPMPQTGQGPFAMPAFSFTGPTAGVGDFTGAPQTATPLPGVTIVTNYVGAEISRTWNAGPSRVPIFGAGGVAVLLGGLVATGIGIARRGKTA